jgi:hypothetical protein
MSSSDEDNNPHTMEDLEDVEVFGRGWGNKANQYYGGSDEDSDSEDDQGLLEKEAQSLKQRRNAQFNEGDFGDFGESDEEEGKEEVRMLLFLFVTLG